MTKFQMFKKGEIDWEKVWREFEAWYIGDESIVAFECKIQELVERQLKKREGK